MTEALSFGTCPTESEDHIKPEVHEDQDMRVESPSAAWQVEIALVHVQLGVRAIWCQYRLFAKTCNQTEIEIQRVHRPEIEHHG